MPCQTEMQAISVAVASNPDAARTVRRFTGRACSEDRRNRRDDLRSTGPAMLPKRWPSCERTAARRRWTNPRRHRRDAARRERRTAAAAGRCGAGRRLAALGVVRHSARRGRWWAPTASSTRAGGCATSRTPMPGCWRPTRRCAARWRRGKRPNRRCARCRRWRRSASSPAASRTTSTTCWRSS